MTKFSNCADTDSLLAHDTYRLTITPTPAGLFSATVTQAALSTALGEAMADLFAAGSIDNLTTYAIPLNQNPYVAGDLAETIDVLIESDGGTVHDLLANVLAVLNQSNSLLSWSGLFTSTGNTTTAIATCERVVGAGAATAGSPDATLAVYSPTAAATRQQDAAAASVQVATGTWLSALESDLGVAGKYILIGGTAFALYYLYKQARRVRRITG